MHWILAAGLGAVLLQSPDYVRLKAAPIAESPSGFVQRGLAIFDVQVSEAGDVVEDVSLYGHAPFTDRSRVSLKDWSFAMPSGTDAHVNVTFLYKPKPGLPDLPLQMDLPLPDSPRPLASPYPTRILIPAFPNRGLYGGTVVLQAGIDLNGCVKYVGVISGPETLLESAVSAMRKWRFHVPDGLEPASRTAIVAVDFQTPEFGIPRTDDFPGESREQAVLVSGTAPSVPVGEQGILEAGNPDGLDFRYGDSHWLVPYSLITGIDYNESAQDQQLLTIAYSGAEGEQIIIFRLPRQLSLSSAAVASSRSRVPIDFKPACACGNHCEEH